MYQVLYRKWRPQVFEDVVGQPHVTGTLLNELRSGRLSHAYLFTGSRGTGKTTCAKILSKAVNCLNPHDGDPCNECEICRGIDNGSILDVVEIDAASNNGVDNIRDLREEANFTPVKAKYRVYIIDEVHMLSIGAFNALLKTLEEPPPHVKFILATTEVHKLPATILSRCQRFDFHRIPPEDMAKRLRYVAEQEEASLTEEAALLIARLADGALRDALSILDQCAGRAAEITADVVGDVAGLTGRDYLFDLSAAICEKKSADALELIDRLHNASCDMERLCTELMNHFRNLLIVKTVKQPEALIICTAAELEAIRSRAASFPMEFVMYALDTFQRTLESMRFGGNRRIEMELALLKLCDPTLETSQEALLQRISALENVLRSGALPSAPPAAAASSPPAAPKTVEPVRSAPPMEEEPPFDLPEPPPARRSQPAPPAAPPAAPVSGTAAGDEPFVQWPQVLDEIMRLDIPLFGVLADSHAFRREDFLLIDSPNPTIKDFISLPVHARAVKQAFYNITQTKCKLGLYHRPAAQKQEQKRDALEDLLHAAQDVGIPVKYE